MIKSVNISSVQIYARIWINLTVNRVVGNTELVLNYAGSGGQRKNVQNSVTMVKFTKGNRPVKSCATFYSIYTVLSWGIAKQSKGDAMRRAQLTKGW